MSDADLKAELKAMRQRLHYKLGDIVHVVRKVDNQVWEATGLIIAGNDTAYVDGKPIRGGPFYIVVDVEKVNGFGAYDEMHNVREDEITDCWHLDLSRVVHETLASNLYATHFYMTKEPKLSDMFTAGNDMLSLGLEPASGQSDAPSTTSEEAKDE